MQEYKLEADDINGLRLVSEFEDDTDICTESFFVDAIRRPFEGRLGAVVTEKVYQELSAEYGVH
jgi:hypothetical protein